MMKPQDILFFIAIVFLMVLKKPWLFVWAGLASIALAIPLFALWVFFTAERLIWYAAGFFLITICWVIAQSIQMKRVVQES